MRLTLGAAQFGLNYGISNRNGKSTIPEVRSILELALKFGIDTIDTAYHYGDSETVLGDLLELTRRFRIITKTRIVRQTTISDSEIALLDSAFKNSLSRLRQSSVAGILIHRADDLLANEGYRLYKWLIDKRDAGKIAKIGASVYSPEQAFRLLQYFDFDIIQAPFNLMDRRILTTELVNYLRSRRIEVHVRSAFLQGLFFLSPLEIPESLTKARPFVDAIRRRALDIGVSINALALAFLRQQPQIDRIVIGVNSAEQLGANIKAYATSLDDNQVFDGLACEDLSIIDPSTWRISR